MNVLARCPTDSLCAWEWRAPRGCRSARAAPLEAPWHIHGVKLSVETEKEVDGRWIAAIDPVGALAYGATKAEAVRKAKAIALEVLADRLKAGESAATGRKTRKPSTFSELHFVA